MTYVVERDWVRALAWYRDAKARATGQWHAQGFQRLIDAAERYTPRESVGTADHERELESRLLKSIDSLVAAARTNTPGRYDPNDGFQKFAEIRDTDEYPEVRERNGRRRALGGIVGSRVATV